MIRSILEYLHYFLRSLVEGPKRSLLWCHVKQTRLLEPVSALPDIEGALAYLARAQDADGSGGIGSYHLIHGWGPACPETTGYCIPTLLLAAEFLDRPDLRSRAERAGDWLLSIQEIEGGWQGGRVGEHRPALVFNTAQVIRGLLALHDAGMGPSMLEASVRAGDWIVSVQEADGAWRAHNFLGVARTYDAYVSAPLLQLHRRTGDPAYKGAALKNLEWVLSRQLDNGWFQDADNTIRHNERPITHTIAYTIDGLLESHIISGDERFLHAARKAASILADRFLLEHRLHGRYDAEWRGSEIPISTGCAQLAVIWSRLHKLTQEPRYGRAAERMVSWLAAWQACSARGPSEMHGAITGSVPLWGRYEKFACPNWAQKYMVDAFLCKEGLHPRN